MQWLDYKAVTKAERDGTSSGHDDHGTESTSASLIGQKRGWVHASFVSQAMSQ